MSLLTAAAGASENSTPQDDLKKIQQALKDRGFDPGAVDGVVGPKTKRALKRFQRSQRLPVTGQIDSRTLDLLCKEAPLGPPRNLRVIPIGEQ